SSHHPVTRSFDPGHLLGMAKVVFGRHRALLCLTSRDRARTDKGRWFLSYDRLRGNATGNCLEAAAPATVTGKVAHKPLAKSREGGTTVGSTGPNPQAGRPARAKD